MDSLGAAYKSQLERKLGGEGGDAQSSDDTKDKDDSITEIKKEPTHFSELDPKTMKVSELRSELEARTMSPKGLKSQLIARLTKAIKTESDKDEEEGKKADEEPEVPEEEEDKETEEKSKKEEEDKKKQDERERAAREKRYAVPETPHILVHPSRTAKGGKFDCTVMSLSLLLDYRPEDTKEHSFEVSLFAELFNEMLMRDHGFRIYRALHFAPEPVKEEKKDKDKKDDKEGKKDEKDGKDKDAKKEEKDKKEDKEKDKDGKKKEDRTSSKDKRDKAEEKEDKDEDEEEDEDEEDDNSQSSKSKDAKEDKDKKKSDKDKKRRDRPKLYTEDPGLLLSFVYFDTSHCGYIFDKDIEELLYTLGLNLSRAQVRKLVQKVVLRDSLHYRKLTDKPKLEEVKEGEEKTAAEPAEPVVAETKESQTMLAYGNKHLLPVFKDASPPSKRARKDDKDKVENVPQGYVTYKGGLLDVDKLTAQLKRSDHARKETEARMITTRDQLDSLRTRHTRTEAEGVRLAAEVAELTAQLATTRADLAKVTTRSTMFRDTLREIGRIGESALRAVKDEVKENGDPTAEQQVKQDTRWSGPNNGVIKTEPVTPTKVAAAVVAAAEGVVAAAEKVATVAEKVAAVPAADKSPTRAAAAKMAAGATEAAVAEKME